MSWQRFTRRLHRQQLPRLPHQPIFYPVLNEEYATQIGSSRAAPGSEQALKATSSWQLLVSPTLGKLGELGWRIGVGLTALNFVLIALATTVSNPRAGRGGNLFFTGDTGSGKTTGMNVLLADLGVPVARLVIGTHRAREQDLSDTVRQFADEVVAPVSAKHDEEHSFLG